jgi:RNA polymerase sigma factor (sigma-70 family)
MAAAIFPVENSDFELLDAWSSGDLAAGRALFERHFDIVYRFLRTKVDAHLEDLVQQTWLACVEGRSRFRRTASFRTYLLQTARFQLYAYYRERRRRTEIGFSESSRADLVLSPSHLAIRHEDERLLLEALRRIPIGHQVVIELSFWQELSGPEIAEVLSIPEPTVRSRLRRAMVHLRRELGSTMNGAAKLDETDDALGPG